MKKIIYRLFAILSFTAALCSCKEMDESYKDFVVQGGVLYTGKASSPVVFAGRNRVKISWLRGKDPSVTKAKVFWNNYSDSTVVAIPPSGDTISVVINNLDEKTYAFIIKTYDSKGNSSVPVEVQTAAFGANYQAGLLSRPLSATLNDAGIVGINWGPANISGGAYATELQYTNKANNLKLQRIAITDEFTELVDLKPGTTINFRTLYLPKPLSIDTFYTAFQPNRHFLYDKSAWAVTAFSSQHTGAANLASNVIDGKADTRWHTHATTSKYPHFVTVDMKVQKTITAFEIFRATGDDRACDTFRMLVSNNNTTWTDLGTFNFNRLSDEGQFYEIPTRPVARYFKFEGLSGSIAYMVTGEINVYGL